MDPMGRPKMAIRSEHAGRSQVYFPDDGRFTLNLDEVAKILGISRAYAYAAARSGSLPTIRVGRRWLVSRATVERLLVGDLVIEAA
jgi:excisionase family DNA binding protein